MSLIGNYTVINKSPAFFSSGISANTRSNQINPSYIKSKQVSIPFKSSLGEGYNLGDVDYSPIKEGGLASINRVEGEASLTGAALQVKTATASITGDSTLSAALSVLTQAAGAITGTASLSGGLLATAGMAATSTGTASLTGSLKSNVPLAGTISGLAAFTVNLTGIASAEGDIDISAPAGLTASAVSEAVWAEVIEAGYSSSELLKLLAAVSFGKTNIVDNGGGSATVTFRDLADTKDRVDADMIGSERSTVTLDAT